MGTTPAAPTGHRRCCKEQTPRLCLEVNRMRSCPFRETEINAEEKPSRTALNKTAMHMWIVIHGSRQRIWRWTGHSGCTSTQNRFQAINRFSIKLRSPRRVHQSARQDKSNCDVKSFNHINAGATWNGQDGSYVRHCSIRTPSTISRYTRNTMEAGPKTRLRCTCGRSSTAPRKKHGCGLVILDAYPPRTGFRT